VRRALLSGYLTGTGSAAGKRHRRDRASLRRGLSVEARRQCESRARRRARSQQAWARGDCLGPSRWRTGQNPFDATLGIPGRCTRRATCMGNGRGTAVLGERWQPGRNRPGAPKQETRSAEVVGAHRGRGQRPGAHWLAQRLHLLGHHARQRPLPLHCAVHQQHRRPQRGLELRPHRRPHDHVGQPALVLQRQEQYPPWPSTAPAGTPPAAPPAPGFRAPAPRPPRPGSPAAAAAAGRRALEAADPGTAPKARSR
jgi:hypothetical protein